MTRLRHLFPLLLLSALATSTAACSGDSEPDTEPDPEPDPEPEPVFSPLNVRGQHFVDADGRTVILRGVNARVEGVFDVVFDDGRERLEPLPDMPNSDCARMAEIGLNLIRLPISWSALEPEQDQFDDTYFDGIDQVVSCAEMVGIFVLVDFHFDAYSNPIGEDGAPLWAIIPEPEELLEGPLTEEELARRRTSGPVIAAYESFFSETDEFGLQAQFIDAIAHVATRYKDSDTVIGIEIFNEPFADPNFVQPFNKAAAARIREVAPAKLAVFNPTVVHLLNGQEDPRDPPFGVSGSVYAPHVYEYLFDGRIRFLPDLTLDDVVEANEVVRAEADLWQTPLLITEFGLGPHDRGFDNYINLQFDAQEVVKASSVFWLWKEQSQGFWGLHDIELDGSWTERPEMFELVSRTYVPRIAGTPSLLQHVDGDFTAVYTEAVDAPNQVYVPERLMVDSITCNGTAVTVAAVNGLLDVPCFEGADAEHTLVIDTSPIPAE